MRFINETTLMGSASDTDTHGCFREYTLVTIFSEEEMGKISNIVEKNKGEPTTVSLPIGDVNDGYFLFKEPIEEVEEFLKQHTTEEMLEEFGNLYDAEGLKDPEINVSPQGIFVSSSFKYVSGTMEQDDCLPTTDFPKRNKIETILSAEEETETETITPPAM